MRGNKTSCTGEGEVLQSPGGWLGGGGEGDETSVKITRKKGEKSKQNRAKLLLDEKIIEESKGLRRKL